MTLDSCVSIIVAMTILLALATIHNHYNNDDDD